MLALIYRYLGEDASQENAHRSSGFPRNRSPFLPLADAAVAYLYRLAVAAAHDQKDTHPTPSTAVAIREITSRAEPTARMSYSQLLELLQGQHHTMPGGGGGSGGLAMGRSDSAPGGQGQGMLAKPRDKCLLCGEPAVAGGREMVACSCSMGHPVCGSCLRQYVLHTHGLQVCCE